MVEATVQERIAEQLPGLEIAAVQGPQGQVRGNVLHQVYDEAGNNYADGYRRLAGESQAGFLVQIQISVDSTLRDALVYNITMTEQNNHDSQRVNNT